MTTVPTVLQWRHVLTTRRLILFATVASLGAATCMAGLGDSPQMRLPAVSTATAAEAAQRPAGFADLVEKVKPAVISVRVKMDAGAETVSLEDNLPH